MFRGVVAIEAITEWMQNGTGTLVFGNELLRCNLPEGGEGVQLRAAAFDACETCAML
jgi:hypothetical protein